MSVICVGNINAKRTGRKNVKVYDIEVEDTHNFFANDILCHNSMYCTTKIPDLVRSKNPDATDEQIMAYLESFHDKYLSPVVKEGFVKLAEYMNADNRMSMKLETISDSGIFMSAKKYCIRVRKSEGVVLAKPKIKMRGIEVVSSSTPNVVKPALREVFSIMLDGIDIGIGKIRDICTSFKNEFLKMSVYDIGISTTMNKSDIYKDLPSGTCIHIRGSIVYNNYMDSIKDHGNRIKDGDRIKYVYLRTPNFLNSHVLSFMDEFPSELMRFVDYDKQFETVFLTPINNKLLKFGYEINMSKVNLKNIFKRSV